MSKSLTYLRLAQATGEEADLEEDLEVANRNLRAALDASQQEVFEVYQQVSGCCHAGCWHRAERKNVCVMTVATQLTNGAARC